MAEEGVARTRVGRPQALVIGVLLVLAGIPMLVCPGPGIGSIAAGVGLILFGITGRRGGGPPARG